MPPQAIQSIPQEPPAGRPSLSRRQFLSGVASFSTLAFLAPKSLLAGQDERQERVLSFFHTHTGERITLPYFADGGYIDRSLTKLVRFLRDFRTGEEHPIDPALFDLLYDVRCQTGTRREFEVISCYRSPRTNAMLRASGRGVAKTSMHLSGKAIDVRLADVSSSVLRDAAKELSRGGVGYYEKSDFVHLDTGRVRAW
jgi:uncharacterized protein YcbK (DUF882 family)